MEAANQVKAKFFCAVIAEFERLRSEIIAEKGNPRDVDKLGGLKDNGDGTFRIVRPKPFVQSAP